MPHTVAPWLVVLACCLAYWLLFQYVYQKKYRRIPLQAALLSFVLAGFGSWLLASVGNEIFLDWAGIAYLDPSAPLATIGWGSLIIGADEELAKFVLVLFIARLSGCFRHPPLAMVFAVSAALGFATMENLHYAPMAGTAGAALRAITATPVHLGCAAVWSLGLAKGRFMTDGTYCRASVCYLLAAVGMHALYNFGCVALAEYAPGPAVGYAAVYGLCMMAVGWSCLQRLLAMHELRVRRIRRECCPKCGKEPETRHSHCSHCGAPLGIGFGLIIRPAAPRTYRDNGSRTDQS